MTLSVVQASPWYPPIHMGGTEVYVSSLVRYLREQDVQCVVATPDDGVHQRDATYEGSQVETYHVPASITREELRRQGPYPGFGAFNKLIERARPDIYHQHGWTRGLGRFHLEAAHDAGIRTILTIHTANFLCLRGTLMLRGVVPCDGVVDTHRCASCWLEARGLPFPMAEAAAFTPAKIGSFVLDVVGKAGGAGTVIASTHLVNRRIAEITAASRHADRIIAVCRWLHEALRKNGVPDEKLVLSPLGVDRDRLCANATPAAKSGAVGALEVLFLGRSDPAKGAHVLVEAFRLLPSEANVRLTLHCLGNEAADLDYRRRLDDIAGGDPRIRIEGPVPPGQLSAVFARADVLAAPSLCLETGPMVVLEAQAMGLTVIGSDLGGIAELVNQRVGGRLVAAGDVAAWRDAILDLVTRRPTRDPAASSSIRNMTDVAGQMAAIYREMAA